MTFLSMFLASTLRRNNAAKRRANVHRVRRSRAAGSVLIHSGQHDSCWLVRVYSNACLTAAGYTARWWLNMCYAGWKWKYTWVYMACAASTFTNKYSRYCSKLYQSSEHSQAFNYGHERPNKPVAKYTSSHRRLHIACAICVFFCAHYISYMSRFFQSVSIALALRRLAHTHKHIHTQYTGFWPCGRWLFLACVSRSSRRRNYPTDIYE